MMAYNRIDDEPILNHERFMQPDYVLVIDPAWFSLKTSSLMKKKTRPISSPAILTKKNCLKKNLN